MKTSNAKLNQKSFSRGLRQALPHLLLLPSIALILSAVMTWANMGLGDDFFLKWSRSFGISLVALPMALICVGALEKQVDAVFASLHWVGRKLIVALLTACVMEMVLALATTLINNPWNSALTQFWWIAFSRSLPVGILIGLFMCFYMKPKLDRMKKAGMVEQL